MVEAFMAKWADLVAGVVCVLLGLVGCFFVYRGATKETPSDVRQSAISAGVAEWRVDPKTGETEFVWIKCQEVGL